LKQGLAWAFAGGLAGLAVIRVTAADRGGGIDAPAAALLPLTPLAAAAGWLTALLSTGEVAASTALSAGALTMVLAPRAMSQRQPAATGPVLAVLTANLLYGRAAPGSVVGLVRRTGAEVLFVQELSQGAAGRLRKAGLEDVLPHVRSDFSAAEPRGNAIYARYPLSAVPAPVSTSSVQPAAMLRSPAGPVRLACIHLRTPGRPWRRSGAADWRADLSALLAVPLPADPADPPLILAGDFNSTVDHAAFRQVLRGGLIDAADQVGNGLVPTWGPLPGGRVALLTLDHVLADPRCAVLASSVHPLPGTDHRAVFARLRLPAQAQPS
jgi:endonuclease/exonuclease/phosphatase family metal-dependent hydrolase